MKIDRAIQTIMGQLGGELLVTANGRISREAFNLKDRAENFYMIGSMGLASAIGLGLAINRPERKVVVLDGDGNLLMSLGILPQTGALLPGNYVHVVLDNEVYGSTGNQPTISSRVCLEEIAKSSGYPEVIKVTDSEALETALRKCLNADAAGPSFILAKIEADPMAESLGRVTLSPAEIKERFMGCTGAEE